MNDDDMPEDKSSPTLQRSEPTDIEVIEKPQDNESSLKKVLAPQKMEHFMSENKTSSTLETTEPTDPLDTGKPQDNESSLREVQAPQMNDDDMLEDKSSPTLQRSEPTDIEVIEKPQGNRRFLIVGIVVALVGAILVQFVLHPEPPPQKSDIQLIDIFLKQLEKMKSRFPNQRAELWNRSKIHLLRHLQTAQPTEPVSLILTAGAKAEKTLHCMAHDLASAFSSALNASVLHINCTSKASQDSDQVKLEIDRKLQRAFEGDKPMAVIHRFEELPPGSTLIFYRYCDHENAAYKKTGLIFTVLLEDVEEIPASSLSTVEEMVDDHLKKKFLSHDYPVSFDKMDLDKYSGLWSRISHLILPVAAVEKIERKGC